MISKIGLEDREHILKEITNSLESKLGNRLVSAIAYGSTLCEDFNDLSDFDVLLVLRDISILTLTQLKEIKEHFKKQNIHVDLNVHGLNEIPEYRKEAFWHNNRGLYMRMELQLYGKILFGENPFIFSGFDKKELHLEAVRVINSLLYQARKLLINRELVTEERVRMMKFCLYAVLYALASENVYPKNKTEAMRIFRSMFPELSDPERFLNNKVLHTSTISDEEVHLAYEFLVQIDEQIFNNLRK